MRRNVLVIMAVGLLLGLDRPSDEAGKKEVEKFQGSWTLILRDGQGLGWGEVGQKLVFTGDKYVLLATDGGPNGNGSLNCDKTTCTVNIDRNETGGAINYCSASVVADGPKSCLDDQATVAQLSAMATAGIIAGAICGFALARAAGSYLQNVSAPGALPVISSTLVLMAAAVVASAIPAARAARVDVIEALRSE